jgi:hypothetical protein
MRPLQKGHFTAEYAVELYAPGIFAMSFCREVKEASR